MVELAPPASRDVGNKPVEDGAVFFVLVYGQVKKLPQEPAALGDPERVSVLCVVGAGINFPARPISHKRDEVPSCQMTQPHYRSMVGGIY